MATPVVFGISMVRNEVDIIRVNVLYHLSLGLDRLLIIDNGSTDGTDQVLRELSERDTRVQWRREDTPYRQSQMLTRLALQAHSEGAEWVLPFDADEFWHVRRGNLKRLLAETTAATLRASVVNYIQRRDQVEPSPTCLLYATRRVAQPIGPVNVVQELVESRQIGYVEADYPLKCVGRAAATMEIHAGNHFIFGLEGINQETNEVACLHVPLRSRAKLDAKANHGQRVKQAGFKPGHSWHLRRFNQLQEQSELDREWAANSHEGGSLDVYGVPHPVIVDYTLRDAVIPFLPLAPWRRAHLFARRLLPT